MTPRCRCRAIAPERVTPSSSLRWACGRRGCVLRGLASILLKKMCNEATPNVLRLTPCEERERAGGTLQVREQGILQDQDEILGAPVFCFPSLLPFPSP